VASLVRSPEIGTGAKPALLPLRSLWLVVLTYGSQFAVVHGVSRSAAAQPWRAALIVIVTVPLLFWIWLNRRWTGVLIIGFGLGLNLLVMIANGGLMPIDPGTVLRAGLGSQLATTALGHALPDSKDILLSTASTHLAILRDWIVVGGFPIFGRVVSPGDLVLFGGLLVTLAQVVRFVLGQPSAARQDAPSVGT